MMMKVKVLVQANLEYGQMREMVHSYQHRLAQARLHIMINYIMIIFIIFAAKEIPFFTPFDYCCCRILLPTENRLLLLRSLSTTELSHLRLRRMFQCFNGFPQMPTLNNGKKKESHAEAELRRDLKKVRCLQRKMGMITFPKRQDFYNIKNL